MPGRWQLRHIAVAIDFTVLLGLLWLCPRVSTAFWPYSTAGQLGYYRVAVFMMLPLNACFGLYAGLNLPVLTVLRRVSGAALCVLGFTGLLRALLPMGAYPGLVSVIILFVPIDILARKAAGSVIRRYRSNPFHLSYVVAVGYDQVIQQLVRQLQSPEDPSSRVVACFPAEERATADGSDKPPPQLDVPQILGYLTRHAADIVVLALSLDELIAAKELIDSILELGLAVGVMPESFDVQLIAHRTDVKTSHGFAGARMIVMRNVFQPAPYLFAKRVLDLVLSSIALLVLSPLFLLIAIMVKVSSEGPVFYPWQVLGRNRKPFTGYKFRTMVCNADEIKKDLMKFNEMTGPVFKMRKDPRVTPIGRWLRKFSLDEIPQFYSVLKGDMSLVGPRPPSKSESDRFEFWQHRKLSVKPGITCLWQVNGRTEIADFAEWAELDLRYIKTASFILDLRILLKTVPVVLFGRGAC